MTTLSTEKNGACSAPDVALYSFNYLLFTLLALVSNQQAQFSEKLRTLCIQKRKYKPHHPINEILKRSLSAPLE